MEARELRIGNWWSGNDYQEHQITIDDLVYLSKGEDIKRIHPIPLSEEWVLKFGFYSHSAGLFRKQIHAHQARFLETILPGIKEFWDFSIIIEHKHKVDDTEVWIKSLKYVHQLQNLYFTLTGNELEIKE